MSKVGVDELFGAGKCRLRAFKLKNGKLWYVTNVTTGRPVPGAFKRKPTRKQLAKIRREVCG